MDKTKKIVLIFMVLIFLVGDLALGRDEQEGIPLSQVPKKVIRAVKNKIHKIRILDAKKIIKEDGEILYLFDGALGQVAYEILVDANGNIQGKGFEKEVHNEVPISKVPAKIIRAAGKGKKQFKPVKAKIVKTKDGIEIYEIEGVSAQETHRVRLELTGKIIGSTIVDKYLENDKDGNKKK